MEVFVFRLIKWTAYVLIGYMIYELFQGMNSQSGASGQGRGGESSSDVKRSVVPGVGTMTGPGRGERVQTENPDGSAVTHVVGRGVV